MYAHKLTQVQVRLRELHDLRYKLYANGVFLRDAYGNQGAKA